MVLFVSIPDPCCLSYLERQVKIESNKSYLMTFQFECLYV